MKRLWAWIAVCIFAGVGDYASPAAAQAPWPAKPVRIVVGFAPGGSTDLTARLYAEALQRAWGAQTVVDNRPGASGILAAELVAKSAPDGHTLLLSPQTSMVIAPLIYKQVSYEPLRDFAPLGVVGSTPQLLVIHPLLPPRTFRDFAAFVRANARTLSFGSGGFGSTQHMAGELLNAVLKVRVAHVPYKGENLGVVDLLAGEIPYMFSNFPVVFPHVQTGRLRALAITSPNRSLLAPELPTVAESGISGFNTASWTGFYAPAKTPADVVKRINGEVIRVVSSAAFRQQLIGQGIDLTEALTPEAHSAFLRAERVRWRRVIVAAGIRPE